LVHLNKRALQFLGLEPVTQAPKIGIEEKSALF